MDDTGHAVPDTSFSRSQYRQTGVNWRAIGIVAAIHAGALAVLLSTGVVQIGPTQHRTMTTFDVTPPPSPPPSRPAPQHAEPQLAPAYPVEQQIAMVQPRITLPSPAQAVAVTPPAPPSPPVAVVAPAAPLAPPAPPAPITPPDFSAAQLGNAGPPYPYLSRRNHEQGTTMLKVLVTASGKAGDILIKTSSGFDRLDKAAIKAVSHWRFTPARQAGKPVDAWVLVPVGFSLG